MTFSFVSSLCFIYIFCFCLSVYYSPVFAFHCFVISSEMYLNVSYPSISTEMCDTMKCELLVIFTSVNVPLESFDVIMEENETPSWFATSPTPSLCRLSALLQAVSYSCRHI